METVAGKNVLRPESYVVEIDGKTASAYGIFVEALKTGLELKQKFPRSRIKVHEADHGRRIEH
jgi:predicted SpoU family rRNA methylase